METVKNHDTLLRGPNRLIVRIQEQPLSPMGYFDLQINGYGGVDFNQDELNADGLNAACQCLLRDGVEGILATFITENVEIVCRRIRRLLRLREADPLARELIVGIHIEGPFISQLPGYRGAHPLDAIMPADPAIAGQLLDAGQGLVRLFTLAPECDAGMKVIKILKRQGVVVSAGHTDATRDQLRAAVDAGLTMATHLGNGCPMTMNRHDNIIQRILSLSDSITPCFIADGVHVPFFALKNYLAVAGIDRAVIVTDAMAAAGMGPGRYRMSRWEVEVGDDLAVWAPGRTHLVGSAGTMRRNEANLMQHLQLTKEQCQQMLADNPKRYFAAAS
jgi:N-acetylglucosamine-6-phosphate deacetylase